MKLFRYASQTLKRVLGKKQSVDAVAPVEFSLGKVVIGDDDIVVSSYPGSGGEKLMQSLSILADQHLFDEGHGRDELSVTPNQKPFDPASIDLSIQFKQPTKLVATNEVFDPRMLTCVFVYRDAAEVLCDNYRRLTSANEAKSSDGIIDKTIDDYCLGNFDEWYAHTESYLNGRSEHDCDLFTLAYESFIQNQSNTLYEVCGFIELDATFQQCRALAGNSVSTAASNYRSTAAEQLEPNTYNTIQNRAQPLYRRAMMIGSDQEAA